MWSHIFPPVFPHMTAWCPNVSRKFHVQAEADGDKKTTAPEAGDGRVRQPQACGSVKDNMFARVEMLKCQLPEVETRINFRGFFC